MTQEEIDQRLREDLSWVPKRSKDLFMINEDGSFKMPPPGPLVIDLSQNRIFLEYKRARQKRIAEITGEQYVEIVEGKIEDYDEYLEKINSFYVKDERTERSKMEQNQMEIFVKAMREKLSKSEDTPAEETKTDENPFPWEEEQTIEEKKEEEPVKQDPKDIIQNLQQIFDSHEESEITENKKEEPTVEEKEEAPEPAKEEPKIEESSEKPAPKTLPVQETEPEEEKIEEKTAEEKPVEEKTKKRSSKKKETADITVSHTQEEIQEICDKIHIGTTNASFREKQKSIEAAMNNIMITSDMPLDLAKSKLTEISQLLNAIWYEKTKADSNLKAYIGKDGLYSKIATLQAEGNNETERRQSVNKFLMNYPLKDGTTINVLEVRASLEAVATFYQDVYDFLRQQQSIIQTFCGMLRTEASL